MSYVVAIVGVAFAVFVVWVAWRSRAAKRETTERICRDMEHLYGCTQERHTKRRGRASSELADARASHIKALNGRANGRTNGRANSASI